MAQKVYRDPIISKVIEKLNAEGPAELKNRYYQGDVIMPARSIMPFCSIAIDNEAINSGDSMEDVNVVPLVLTVVVATTKDIKSFDLASGTTKLYELFAARKEDYSLREDSIAYVMRKYAQLDNKLFVAIQDAPLTADFGIGVGRRGPGIFSVEGSMRATVYAYTPTPRRSDEP